MNFVRLPVLRHGVMQRYEELLPDEVFDERLDAVRGLMREYGVGALLIYADSVANGPVCWLTAYPCYGYNKKAVAVLGLDEPPVIYNSEPLRNVPIVRPFTRFDLIRERRYFPEAVKKAAELAAGRPIGLVGTKRIGASGWKTITEGIAPAAGVDMSDAYGSLMSAADFAALNVMKQSAFKAKKALEAMTEAVRKGESLWKLAADADYSMRMDGCEDANVMTDCGEGALYPSYPVDKAIGGSDTVLLYTAAQFARYWGVAGRSVSADGSGSMQELTGLKQDICGISFEGMTLKEAEEALVTLAAHKQIALNRSVSILCGIGMDLQAYPCSKEDVIRKGAVLQVTLLTGEPSVGMLVDALCIGDAGNFWLANIE